MSDASELFTSLGSLKVLKPLSGIFPALLERVAREGFSVAVAARSLVDLVLVTVLSGESDLGPEERDRL